MTGVTWPKEAFDALAAAWPAGRSATACAALIKDAAGLSVTRNAVIGMIHRARRRGEAWAVQRSAESHRVESKAASGTFRLRAPAPAKRAPSPPRPLPEPAPEAARPIAEIGGGCHWIVEAYAPGAAHQALACGAARAGRGPYCAAHAARAVQPRQKPWKLPRKMNPRGLPTPRRADDYVPLTELFR